MECACGQQLNLWKSGENLVDKPTKKSSDAMSLTLKTTDSLDSSNLIQTTGAREADLVNALIDANQLLAARIYALENEVHDLMALIAEIRSEA